MCGCVKLRSSGYEINGRGNVRYPSAIGSSGNVTRLRSVSTMMAVFERELMGRMVRVVNRYPHRDK